ncbi:MAG: DUF1194 domain-containing protein [Rhodobacteraceae bacterium]|nr:DUF1194 domain-containing protein [Paracoccaceae bacterium]
MRTLALLLLTSVPAEACRLALALGFDVSASVDAADYAIQRDGIVAALAAPEIRRAFLEPGEPVALAVFEWAGRRWQQPVAGWVLVETAADLDRVAEAVAASEGLRPWEPTAIGAALVHALDLFGTAPDCAARTLDLSGDGRNNDWLDPGRIYAREDFGDIVVNALAIGGHEADIAAYYAAEVIRGPGAFVEPARTHADFPPAIRRKLERELTGPVLGTAPRPAVRTRG